MGMVPARRSATPAAAFRATPKWLRLDVAVRDEAFLDRPGDCLAQQPLDAPQQVRLIDADETDRVARGAGSSRSTDPMDVVLRVPRQLGCS